MANKYGLALDSGEFVPAEELNTTQPEALRLATASNAMADEGEMIHLLSWHEIRNLLRANVAELRRQHARIAELEAQLSSSGFSAADMATAAAQGFRDGVASVAASAGSEPAAWVLTSDLTRRETTTKAHLWFSDPVNCMWTPIFTTPQPAAAPTPVDPFDALRWGANVAETLLSIGRAIGFGRAQQILGEQWEAAHGCAPRGRMGVTVKDEVTCQMCGGKPYPGCNTEFQGEAACRFTQPSPTEGMVGGWIALPGTLPKPGTPVLLDIGKKYPIRAMWAAKHTVQAADDDTDWGEYVETDDMYYAPEGWYEWNECEDNHWRVTSTPVAWCALPAPSSDKGAAHG